MFIWRRYYNKWEVNTKKDLFNLLDEIHKRAGIKEIVTMKIGNVLWANRKSINAYVKLKRKVRIAYYYHEVETDDISICLGEYYTCYDNKFVGRKEIEKMKRWMKEWCEKNNVEFREVD